MNGVAQVDVYGSQKYAVRVQVDPDALASRGIGIDDVRTAISQGNSNLPGGTLDGLHKAYTIDATGQLSSAAQFRPMIVSYRNGRPVQASTRSRGLPIALRTRKRQAGLTASDRSCLPFSGSPARTP